MDRHIFCSIEKLWCCATPTSWANINLSCNLELLLSKTFTTENSFHFLNFVIIFSLKIITYHIIPYHILSFEKYTSFDCCLCWENQEETHPHPIPALSSWLTVCLVSWDHSQGKKNLNDLWRFQQVSQKQKYGRTVPNFGNIHFHSYHVLKNIGGIKRKIINIRESIFSSNLIEHLCWFFFNAVPIFTDRSAPPHDILRWIQKYVLENIYEFKHFQWRRCVFT